MNSNDVNSVINNLCDKLGTTASKLIPEMAGYQIAKHSIWMVISLIFIGVAIGFTIRLLWMHKKDGETLAIYPDLVRKIDLKLKDSGMMDELYPCTRIEWANTLEELRRVKGTMQWDESTWCAMVLTAVWSGLIGIVIFGISLYHIIGWCIAPNASAFMWIVGQLGGGQ
jgi:hypothetical protein